MELLIKNLANLLKVKTIISLIVVITLSVLVMKESLEADKFLLLGTTIIGFYFGTQHEKQIKKEDK